MSTEHAFDIFYQELQRRVGMPRSDWAQLKAHCKVREVPAKYCLQEIGQTASHCHFIVSGLVRYYYNKQGKELNKAFYKEGWPVGNLSAMIMEEPSRFAIETLEPCILIQYAVKDRHTLAEQYPSWGQFFSRSCELMLVRNERREAELLTSSSRERYLQFLKNFPDFEQRIPQYHIASYLGITPVALSKYKKQWLEIDRGPS